LEENRETCLYTNKKTASMPYGKQRSAQMRDRKY